MHLSIYLKADTTSSVSEPWGYARLCVQKPGTDVVALMTRSLILHSEGVFQQASFSDLLVCLNRISYRDIISYPVH